eukprot:m.40907 g.40907  ORF g.40907 m.40907 type:complete len:410 (+) comp5640_c0_seq2:160-1389(+)
MAPVTAIVVGAGNRGFAYSAYAKLFPDRLKIVAVAEPRQSAREKFQSTFGVESSGLFDGWEAVLAGPKLADFAMITTQDHLHKAPAIAFARAGYHILLEKPMATTEQDCKDIVQACAEAGVIFAVCHVLRYAPANILIKKLIADGTIGDLVNIQHTEPIGSFHFAHSFVRGNWRREDQSSFSLLTKSCHDIDLLSFWMDRKCLRVSSFGSLQHFRAANRPAGAADNCLDCPLQNTCPYSALKYRTSGFASTVKKDADIEDLEAALRAGPYGRCVYACDNDVVDHQVVNMEFEGGRTASFTMVAFTEKMCVRRTVVHGTRGELTCDDGETVRHFDFATGTHQIINSNTAHAAWGHGGSDYYTIESFVKAVAENDRSLLLTGGGETLRSHLLVFAAERARRSGTVVAVDDL